MQFNKNQKAFFSLLRAGLWETDVQLSSFGDVDFQEVYRLAEEQSVIGLVAAGLEHVKDVKLHKAAVLPFLTQVIVLEQRNVAMNTFIKKMVSKLGEDNVKAVLVKGQGVAQTYSRPLWRASGDVDLFLSDSNYEGAKKVLCPVADSVDPEDLDRKHLAIQISGFEVELHGTLKVCISKRWDDCLARVQSDVFENGGTRIWNNDGTDVLLPSTNNDVVFVFSHILQHFYHGGIGLRQICDWCRLLYTYRDSINQTLLLKRLELMDILPEWKGFAALAVDSLGMPAKAMPFYDASPRWSRKANRILSIVLKKGNFGHNVDMSYYQKQSFVVKKAISLSRHFQDYFNLLFIFPKNTWRSFWHMLRYGVEVAAKGE